MANPTNPFNWQMPTATDLVTDLPADFETFGQAVATSMADLLGGTTGQVLSKTTNTDMDFTWVTPQVGDITAVTAGTGLSGGGTSGAVTITNDMATTITASGDIVIGTGSGTYDNLPIGTTGQLLTADTTVSPYKVKWATPAATSGPAFRAFRSSTAQSFTQNVFTKVQFNGETFDTDSCFDSTTNYRFTPTKAGYYQVQTTIEFSGSADTLSQVQLYKNGSAYSNLLYNTKLPASIIAGGSDIVELNGSTDYIEIFGKNSSASPSFAPGNTNTYFSACWLRGL